MNRLRLILLLSALLVPAASSEKEARLELGSPFDEHMILQRDLPVPVWGWGTPKATVTVEIAGERQTAVVDGQGRWRLELPPLKAGGPHSFTTTCEEERISFQDVLIGEVWICSGQSNMAWPRSKMDDVQRLEKEAVGRPLRSMHVKNMFSIREEERCAGDWVKGPSDSAVAFAFQLRLQEILDVPVGVIITCLGGSAIEAWMPSGMTETLPHFKKEVEAFETKGKAAVIETLKKMKENPKAMKNGTARLRATPHLLFNGMMKPVIPYGARGLVWYQGEANTKTLSAMRQYGVSLPAWCSHLRELWGREDFHLLAVMLPGFGRLLSASPVKDPDHPSSHSWAWMREAQANLLSLPHTGIANTIDLGDVERIHPTDKAPIGRRLALLAARDVNGKALEAEGPCHREGIIEGGKLRLHFDHAEGLRTKDGRPPREFWIAGKDGDWHPATAAIEGTAVLLSSEKVPAPAVVRYAWTGKPDVNLVNGEGLPAVPFRTDTATLAPDGGPR